MTAIETTEEHVLCVLDRTGDTRTIWNPREADEVDAARKTFNELRKKGYLAYKVTDNGKKGEQITEFDPQAGKVIMAPAMAGG